MFQKPLPCWIVDRVQFAFLKKRFHNFCACDGVALINGLGWCRVCLPLPFIPMTLTCVSCQISKLRLGLFFIEIITAFRTLNSSDSVRHISQLFPDVSRRTWNSIDIFISTVGQAFQAQSP